MSKQPILEGFEVTMGGMTMYESEQQRRLSGDYGLSSRGAVALIGTGAVLALVVASYVSNLNVGPEFTDEQEVEEVESAITRFAPDFNVCIGDLDTHTRVQLNVNNGLHLNLPWTDASPGFNWHSEFEVEGPTSVGFCFDGSPLISDHTRDDQDLPTADDEITFRASRDSLFLERPGIDTDLTPSTFTVEGGFVTERDGEELEQPEPIFAEDGEYSTGVFDASGEDSNFTNITEWILPLGDNGAEAETNALAIASLQAGSPECIYAATEIVPLETMARAAIFNEFEAQGYDRTNIHIDLRGVWPSPNEMVDDNGQTYADKLSEIEEALNEDQSVEAATTCSAGNVEAVNVIE